MDACGASVPDVSITAPFALYIFRNPAGLPEESAALGCGVNFTLY